MVGSWTYKYWCGFGSAVQGFDVGQLVAFAKSGVTVADLHICIFDCAKGD